MTEFGGLGGSRETPALDPTDLFEVAVNRVLGDKIRADEEVGRDVWSAITNVNWIHTNGDTASYSFRRAGDLLAAICGRGNYMDWYCRSNAGVVSAEISAAMAAEGWRVSDVPA